MPTKTGLRRASGKLLKTGPTVLQSEGKLLFRRSQDSPDLVHVPCRPRPPPTLPPTLPPRRHQLLQGATCPGSSLLFPKVFPQQSHVPMSMGTPAAATGREI